MKELCVSASKKLCQACETQNNFEHCCIEHMKSKEKKNPKWGFLDSEQED